MRRYHAIVIALGAFLATLPATAQLPTLSQHALDAESAVRAGQYLAASDLLAPEALSATGAERNIRTFQLWSQITPFMTNELDPALFGSAAPDPSWARRIEVAEPRDAIPEIVARARRTTIVILNEAHVSPRDRAFALQVARALRPLGYHFLAAETFANDSGAKPGVSMMPVLRDDGFVRRNTGFYTLDPVFAGFVREALAIGYQPVAYEESSKQRSPSGDVQVRETHQAQNLRAFLQKNPGAKIMVYVGYGHVRERSEGAGRVKMAAERLKQLAGIDPLTIDQVALSDLSPKTRDAYAAATAQMGTRPAVFFEHGHPLVLGTPANYVDLQVVHPPRTYRDGRPTWLQALGGHTLPIPSDLLPAQGRRLVQVFAADAPADAVPLDQVLLKAGQTPPMLMIPSGPVRFAFQDGT